MAEMSDYYYHFSFVIYITCSLHFFCYLHLLLAAHLGLEEGVGGATDEKYWLLDHC